MRQTYLSYLTQNWCRVLTPSQFGCWEFSFYLINFQLSTYHCLKGSLKWKEVQRVNQKQILVGTFRNFIVVHIIATWSFMGFPVVLLHILLYQWRFRASELSVHFSGRLNPFLPLVQTAMSKSSHATCGINVRVFAIYECVFGIYLLM